MRKYGIVWTSASIMWLYTLPHKYLIDLSRQGRQKGVRICLLFHKASSIFIGFHAGVNIESKTFFASPTATHPNSLSCPEHLLLSGCTVVWQYDGKTKFYWFPWGCKHRIKTFFCLPKHHTSQLTLWWCYILRTSTFVPLHCCKMVKLFRSKCENVSVFVYPVFKCGVHYTQKDLSAKFK